MRRFLTATMPTVAGVALLILGTTTVSWAGAPLPVPEIDPSTGIAALTLVAGAVLIMRGRRKK